LELRIETKWAKHPICGLGVAGDFVGVFVVAEVNELVVTENASGGPFGEFDFGNGFGFEPDVIFHVLGGNAFAPVPGAGAREIRKGTTLCGLGLRRV